VRQINTYLQVYLVGVIFAVFFSSFIFGQKIEKKGRESVDIVDFYLIIIFGLFSWISFLCIAGVRCGIKNASGKNKKL
jgi:hypothetical protein